MTDLLELANHCHEASGPDRSIDGMIAHAIGASMPDDPAGWPPAYTKSTDAAMTLVPAGISVLDLTLSWDTLPDNGHPACSIRWYPSDTSDKKSWHACTRSGRNAALAICNAALTMRGRAVVGQPGARDK